MASGSNGKSVKSKLYVSEAPTASCLLPGGGPPVTRDTKPASSGSGGPGPGHNISTDDQLSLLQELEDFDSDELSDLDIQKCTSSDDESDDYSYPLKSIRSKRRGHIGLRALSPKAEGENEGKKSKFRIMKKSVDNKINKAEAECNGVDKTIKPCDANDINAGAQHDNEGILNEKVNSLSNNISTIRPPPKCPSSFMLSAVGKKISTQWGSQSNFNENVSESYSINTLYK